MGGTLFVDVTDLLDWLTRFERVSGIQRIVVELVRNGLPPNGKFVRAGMGMWQTVETAALAELCEHVSGGQTSRSEMNRLLAQLHPRGASMGQGDVLYLPGAFWVTGGMTRSVRWAKSQGTRIVGMFYDMIPWRRPDLCGAGTVSLFENVRDIVKLLDAAHAISWFTSRELWDYMTAIGVDIPVNVHQLAHQFGTVQASVTERVTEQTQRSFVLCVGSVQRRKNQEMLYRVWQRLHAELGEECPDLLCVGSHWREAEPFVETVVSGALGGLVRFVTDASDAELAALYDRCMFTVFPSLYEGWGLPVGESLDRGKLCVASSGTAVPEVGGELAVYADPTNENENFEVIAGLLRHPERLRSLTERVASEFQARSWASVFDGIFDDLTPAAPSSARRPAWTSPPKVRLYGYMTGEGSFTQVTRGMERALSAAGQLAGTCSLSAADEEPQPGADAPFSLNCGNPMGLMMAHRLGQHRSSWLLLAPNGETLPAGLVETLVEPSKVLPRGLLTGGLVAPSRWAAGVLRRYFPDRPVVISPHGVTPDIHRVDAVARDAARRAFRAGRFDVLHMTSSETERKGTRLLLAAWKRLKDRRELPAQAMLYVVMNPTQVSKVRWWCADLGLTEADVSTAPGLVLSQEDVVGMYSNMHAICQPSRGEGFGLVPLEGLACGVPAVVTACTGHSEYLGSGPPGSVIVEHGEIAPMDDFQGSMAPTVSVDAICEALERAFTYWESVAAQAEMNAAALAREWSWENKSAPGIRRLIQEAEAYAQ